MSITEDIFDDLRNNRISLLEVRDGELVTDADAEALAIALSQNYSLRKCIIHPSSQVSAEAKHRIFKALEHHPTCVTMDATKNSFVMQDLSQLIDQFGQNKKAATELYSLLELLDPASWKPADLARAMLGIVDLYTADELDDLIVYYGGTPANKAPNPESAREFLRTWQQVPGLQQMMPLTLDGLSRRSEDRFKIAPLDNPKFWQKFEEAAQSLAAQGTPITKQLLLQTNRDGDPYLLNAARCGEIGQVVDVLNRQGETIGKEELLDRDGQPTALLQAIIGTRQAHRLFTPENWVGQSTTPIQTVYRALPPEAQHSVQNYYGLLHTITRQQRASEQGRG